MISWNLEKIYKLFGKQLNKFIIAGFLFFLTSCSMPTFIMRYGYYIVENDKTIITYQKIPYYFERSISLSPNYSLIIPSRIKSCSPMHIYNSGNNTNLTIFYFDKGQMVIVEAPNKSLVIENNGRVFNNYSCVKYVNWPKEDINIHKFISMWVIDKVENLKEKLTDKEYWTDDDEDKALYNRELSEYKFLSKYWPKDNRVSKFIKKGDVNIILYNIPKDKINEFLLYTNSFEISYPLEEMYKSLKKASEQMGEPLKFEY